MIKEPHDAVRIADHAFWFVPPDQIHFAFRGEFAEGHADTYLDFVFKHADESGRPLYSMYDLSTFTRATEGGRKCVINVKRPYPYAALAVVGAPFSTRAVAEMILTAGRLIAPKHFSFPIKFWATAADAEAWFDELREKRD